MPITSLNTSRKPSYTKYINLVIGLIATGLIIYFGKDLISNIGLLGGRSVLTVTNTSSEAEVYLDGKLLGKTPFESKEIKPGENKVTVKTAGRQYETTINFLPNTQVVLNRDLGVSDNFSSGQNFWMEKSPSGVLLSVTSEPSGASVFIDNTQVGKTPYSSATLTPGEYDLRVDSAGFESQVTRIKIQSGYNLNVSFKLFPVPAPTRVAAFEDSTNLFDISVSNPMVTSDSQNWAKAAAYWNKTRGINLANLGINKEPVFDYFIDYQGQIYNRDGILTTDVSQLKDAEKGAYLGRTTDGSGLSQQAKDALAKIGEGVPTGKTAKILETGTGWLRVRDTAGLGGAEIARVDVGGTYPVIEEQAEWVKIKVSDAVSGWVSKTYTTIAQ